ncbi:hypothetical protein L226DRAFT_569003 [Lentinus tigrinus ALCF2SS1-7]|uniref:uncharacterized protein n=1 Tax=Lentinus tigrinus ALCF2SS1-7 TaxID=1328758 RepID=UPI001165D459|nr:hypothetical protein L226DRAFT_569003 [Lentinus tigrinus ALCF2SS1-7]
MTASFTSLGFQEQEQILHTRAHSGLNSHDLTSGIEKSTTTPGNESSHDSSPNGHLASTNKPPLLFIDFAAYSRDRSRRSVCKDFSESFPAPATVQSSIGEGPMTGAHSSVREHMLSVSGFIEDSHAADGMVFIYSSSSVTELPQDDMTSWEDLRESRDYRYGKGATVWYRTSGPYSVCQPPSSLPASVDELYIHRDERNSRSKCWVVNTEGCWVAVLAGDKQPSNPLRRLSFQRNGDPSWVTRKTYSVYRSRWRRGRAVRDPP